MANSNRPKWLNIGKLEKAAGKEADHREKLQVNLPVHSHKVITAYICPQCRLQFTSSDVEAQVKKAARAGTQYIECPKCGGILREGRTAVVEDVSSIVSRADKYTDSNRAPDKAPGRSIDTWVDKAIYGKLVQKLGEHIQQYGINNPQLRFQRGIRAQKFPGQPKTAKGAEFTVEFVDFNNTRNRIVIQAGLNVKGEFIYPRTFRTLSGSEYPLTKQAINDFISGKLYDPVMSDAKIKPLLYRYPDPTRFREISANNKKMQKKAQDNTQDNSKMMNPEDIQAMENILGKYKETLIGSTPMGMPPASTNATPGGAFMNGVGLSSKLNMQKAAEFPINEGMQESELEDNSQEQQALEVLYNAVTNGLSFPEAYDEVRNATQGNTLITQEEYDQMGQLITGTLMGGDVSDNDLLASKAAELVKQAEIDTVKHLYKTAETVKSEFVFNDMAVSEIAQWTKVYAKIYNNSLDKGKGVVTAAHRANEIADDVINRGRIKRALRDKDTLVPQVDTDPDWSIATTDEFEAEFGGKYEDTDGGILPMEDRNYNTMFKGSSVNKIAIIRHEDDKWVVKSEDGSEVLGTHSTKAEAEDQLQAIHIQQHGSIQHFGEYQLTPSGETVLTMLSNAQPVEGFNSSALASVLTAIMADPSTTPQDLLAHPTIEGPSPYQLQVAFNNAVQRGFIQNKVSEEENISTLFEDEAGSLPEAGNKLNMQKSAESTGLDLDSDEVGQNPINYSRLKSQIQDLLRAGNIPPSKVDLHRLKDGGYSLDELHKLVDTFKVNTDTYFPTSHAKVDSNQVQKRAEKRLSDLFKQMPLEKEDARPPRQHSQRVDDGKLPPRRTETCPDKDSEGNVPPRQWKNRRDNNE